MVTPNEKSFEAFIVKTESAVLKLFDAVDTYINVLRSTRRPVFITCSTSEEQREAEYKQWAAKHEYEIQTANEAQRKFTDDIFAYSVICGSILQIAFKSLELFSQNNEPVSNYEVFTDTIENGKHKRNQKAIRYCIGREVRGVPLGLIVYAGRNQHIHFEEPQFKDHVNSNVFDQLATHLKIKECRDPAFDLRNPKLESYAHNIIALMKWRSYESYLNDMRAMLPPG